MSIKYQWKPGSRVSVSPSAVHRFLEDCRKKDGGNLRLERIITDSKPHKALCHNQFEWNDAKAGHMLRMDQARYIVRSLEVVRPEMQPYREYESVNIVSESEFDSEPVKKAVFRRTEDILADPDARYELLLAAIRDANAYKRKYAQLSELALLFKAIEKVVKQVAV